MVTKRITCREWCKKNNVPIESLVNREGELRMIKTSSVDIIMQSKAYTSKMDAIMRALYIGEYVIVKHQDVAGETIDKTGEISYIHPHKTYFNVKFDDTGVQESYYPSDVFKGTVIL